MGRGTLHLPTSWARAVPLVCAVGCGSPPSVEPAPPVASAPVDHAHPSETHLADVRQLTFGGENAEAYWSFDDATLIYQAHSEPDGCDQIYTMRPGDPTPEPTMVSTGKGATTCAYFLPGNSDIVYSSTHLGGDACPPKPDRSQGYVWPIYASYDIFRAKADGSGLTRLTDTPGYDAEATVCPMDGSIVFTSVRDGDLDLYRMDANGKNVKRLTDAPGYDGGAFFNADCTKLVWRASRPKGEALEDYRRLLDQGLVRPSKLELYVGNADGSDARQITYLDAAAFGPFFHPSSKRVLFSTNYGDPKGREFDLWAIDVDGTNLERITHTPGFDGFPMFSHDGQWLAFGSNRANEPGSRDTNVFVARWIDEPRQATIETAADRLRADVAWLADPARGGRGIGTEGLEASGRYVAKRFAEAGLEAGGEQGSYRQTFEVTTSVSVGDKTTLTLGDRSLRPADFQPLASSAEGRARGDLVLAGYGISAKEIAVDDYAGVRAKGKIVVVRRFVPDTKAFVDTRSKRRYGDLRYKAWVAKQRGAKALIVVDAPLPPPGAKKDWQPPTEAPFPALHVEGHGNSGIPVLVTKREALASTLAKLAKGGRVRADLEVDLTFGKAKAFNVVGRLPAGAPSAERVASPVVIGAHYDHLGLGGAGSLAPDQKAPHLGADDNASGVAALIEVARALGEKKSSLRRDVWFVAFSGEESGLLGSTHFTRSPPASLDVGKIGAMINMDMVGRLRKNRLTVLGGDSAKEWKDLLAAACDASRIECVIGGDGYGPSDQTPFYASGVPVLHFFTGAHSDYHKPSDTVDKLNAAGAGQIAGLVAEVARTIGEREAPLTYNKVPSPTPRGDLRSFNASLGSVPDYAGPQDGREGVLLAGVRPGGAAEKAGMRRGDLLVRLGVHEVRNVRDLMYALNASKPGQTVKAVVMRGDRKVTLEVTFQERQRRHH